MKKDSLVVVKSREPTTRVAAYRDQSLGNSSKYFFPVRWLA